MTALLVRGTELTGLPVVTIDGGEDVAEVKDVVYDPDEGRVLGFTLNKRGFLGGPMREALTFESVAAVGRDAVMVESDSVLGVDGSPAAIDRAKGRNVLGNDVITDAGRRLGEVVDIVVEATTGRVVGYELRGDEQLQGHAGRPLLLPIPDTLAVSGDALLVPDGAEPFIRDDLSGFGAAVDDFRDQLRGEHGAPVRRP